ncbi:hypothetical protein EXN66_Car002702 [Channa argus]|uniref:Uncharacterized protein n=1 Tax=Channa argus TaxID=215402 RepID=A0A6G1P9Q1_CHAAH|nr:hypothetical protein EXN66_Car002702 [Channa argus]
MAKPLLRQGFSIAAPHLQKAATDIVGDVVSSIGRSTQKQEGNGLAVYCKRPIKRPPVGYRLGITEPKTSKKNHVRIAKKKPGHKRGKIPYSTGLTSTEIF